MSLLKVKLDVYPLENYIQNRPGRSAEDGGAVVSSGRGNAHKKDSDAKRHKTPLEKLMSLKSRCMEENCVQSVEAILIAHLHRHPHVILLKQPQHPGQGGRAGGPRAVLAGQAAASGGPGEFLYRLPGGRCRRGETEESCLHRKLGRQLLNEAKAPADGLGGSAAGQSSDTVVDVAGGAGHGSEAANYFRLGEVLSKWYRPHFSPLMYPYVPPHIAPGSLKEVRTVFLVHLEPTVYFNLYREDTELVAVPLFDLYENSAKYGPIVASLPVLLSRVLINYCSTDY